MDAAVNILGLLLYMVILFPIALKDVWITWLILYLMRDYFKDKRVLRRRLNWLIVACFAFDWVLFTWLLSNFT